MVYKISEKKNNYLLSRMKKISGLIALSFLAWYSVDGPRQILGAECKFQKKMHFWNERKKEYNG